MVVLRSVEEWGYCEGMVFGGGGTAELDEKSVGVTHFGPREGIVPSFI